MTFAYDMEFILPGLSWIMDNMGMLINWPLSGCDRGFTGTSGLGMLPQKVCFKQTKFRIGVSTIVVSRECGFAKRILFPIYMAFYMANVSPNLVCNGVIKNVDLYGVCTTNSLERCHLWRSFWRAIGFFFFYVFCTVCLLFPDLVSGKPPFFIGKSTN